MKTQILTYTGLVIYDQKMKDYIKSQGIGVTLEDVQELIDASEKNTTYTLSKNENNEIVLTGSDGSSTKVSDKNTTYNFLQTGTTLTITSSDGSNPITITLGEDITSEKIINVLGYTPVKQSYVDNKLIISSIQPSSQETGEWLEVLS